MVGAVRHRLGALPADRAAALAHDRRPPRARARARPPAAHAAADPGRLRARLPGRRARAAAGRSRTGCSTARRRSTGSSSSRCWPTRRATSRAAGSPGTSGSASTAGSCSWRRRSRLLFALAVAVGIAEGQTAVALGMAAAPFVSLVVVPLAFARAARPRGARRRAPRATSSASPAAGASRRGAGDHARRADAAQRGRADHRPDGRGRGRGRLRVQRAADRARAAAALPGRPGLAPPPPRRAWRRARGRAEARRAVRITVLAIAGFALAVAAGLLVLGPWAMDLLFDDARDLRALGPRARRARHGLPPDGGHAQPGGARARPRRPGRGGLAARRGVVFVAWLRRAGGRRRAAARRGWATAGPRRCCAAHASASRCTRARSGKVGADMAYTLEHDPIDAGHLVSSPASWTSPRRPSCRPCC